VDRDNYFFDVNPNGRVFAHRGFWAGNDNLETFKQNSLKSFLRAEQFGFSVETDIRDRDGKVCISHDPIIIQDEIIELSEIWSLNSRFAFNIKCDGLINLFNEEGIQNNRRNFFFDGSTPEMVKYRGNGFLTANRLSDLEQYIVGAQIYWVDYFESSEWYLEFFKNWSDQAAYIFVSPELHSQPHENFWKIFKPLFNSKENFGICTDYPDRFVEFING
jgi:hypothetical protein